jgi:hypothetical protein
MHQLDINFDEDKTLPIIDLDEGTASVVGHNMRSLTLCSDWPEENCICKDCARKINIEAQIPYSFFFKTSD